MSQCLGTVGLGAYVDVDVSVELSGDELQSVQLFESGEILGGHISGEVSFVVHFVQVIC